MLTQNETLARVSCVNARIDPRGAKKKVFFLIRFLFPIMRGCR
jgi:hypothetical protein